MNFDTNWLTAGVTIGGSNIISMKHGDSVDSVRCLATHAKGLMLYDQKESTHEKPGMVKGNIHDMLFILLNLNQN